MNNLNLALKRKLQLETLLGVTINKTTDEFVIHGTDSEYDYNYISHDRGGIIEAIEKAYFNLVKQKLKFSGVNEKSLKVYVTNKKEKKANPSFTRMRTDRLADIEAFLNGTEGATNTPEGENPNKKATSTMYSSHKTIKNVKLEDFKILKVIGRGSFGKVCLVEYLPTHEIYAMKSLKKDVLIEQEQIENTLLEKEILQTIDYPLLCGLIFCFQTEERIYFILPFLSGGELFQHLRKFRTFDEEKVRFYGAQIAMALDYLHNKGIIYRDLKPENILMDENGYLRLTDFGMAKKLGDNEKAMSFCGTPEYLAPEIITMEGHDKSADWWSFGVLLFEMLCGLPPFYVENLDKMYELIKNSPIKFPKRITLQEDTKDIIKKLLEKNPKKRLGSQGGLEEIKKHPFFANVDWELILQKKVPAPFVPKLSDDKDVQYFDEEFTSEDVGMSYIPKKNMDVIKANQKKFKDFSQ